MTASEIAGGSWAAVRAPTVVIHGDHDPLPGPVAGGLREPSRAQQLRGSCPGWGHDLPQAL